MKTIATVVYSAAELTGMAREKALDFMRADSIELAAALIEQLPGAYLIDADEIRRAAAYAESGLDAAAGV